MTPPPSHFSNEGDRSAGIGKRLKQVGYASPFYRALIAGRRPESLIAAPIDPWTGNGDTGLALLEGRYRFNDREAAAPGQPPWLLRPHDLEWTRALHGFTWLRDLKALDTDTARQTARRLVTSWIDTFNDWDDLTWAPDVVARRLIAWLGHTSFLMSDAESDFVPNFLDSIMRQVRHLGLSVNDCPPGRARLTAALGLSYAGGCLPGEIAKRDRGLALVEKEVARMILSDGGAVSRCPNDTVSILRDIVQLRHGLRAAAFDPPYSLQDAEQRMTAFVAMMCHEDGGLGVFNGGDEGDFETIRQIFDAAKWDEQIRLSAPRSGYERLQVERAAVLVDTGLPIGPPHAAYAYAGSLAMEFSVDGQRIVVNCGNGADRGGDWAAVGTATAAHSTLTVNDTNAAALQDDGSVGRRATAVVVDRDEDADGNMWFDGNHDGYRDNFGLVHRRRIYLSNTGEDLRGHDTLTYISEHHDQGHTAILRFHLCPGVQASLVNRDTAVLMRLPSGDAWRFRASGGDIGIEESIYMGRDRQLTATEQITLTGHTGEMGLTLRWAFHKVPE